MQSYNNTFFEKLLIERQTTTQKKRLPTDLRVGIFELTGIWNDSRPTILIFNKLNYEAKSWLFQSLPIQKLSSISENLEHPVENAENVNPNWTELDEKIRNIAETKSASLDDLVNDFGFDTTKIELSFVHNDSSKSSSGNFSGNSTASLGALSDETTVLEASKYKKPWEPILEKDEIQTERKEFSVLNADDKNVAETFGKETSENNPEDKCLSVNAWLAHPNELNQIRHRFTNYLSKMKQVNFDYMSRYLEEMVAMKSELGKTISNLPKIEKVDATGVNVPKLNGTLDVAMNWIQNSVIQLEKVLSNVNSIHVIQAEIFFDFTEDFPGYFDDDLEFKKPLTLDTIEKMPSDDIVILEKLTSVHNVIVDEVEELENEIEDLQENLLLIFGRIQTEIEKSVK